MALGDCAAGPAGNVRVVRLTLSQAVTGAQGDAVAMYTLTRYDVGADNGVSWLRRNSGVDLNDAFVPQPLAGPLVAADFSLEYRDAVGTVIAAPVPAANLANIRQVRIRITTESSQRMNGNAQQDAGETVVTLRNN
jgi:hypothetical protein